MGGLEGLGWTRTEEVGGRGDEEEGWGGGRGGRTREDGWKDWAGCRDWAEDPIHSPDLKDMQPDPKIFSLSYHILLGPEIGSCIDTKRK